MQPTRTSETSILNVDIERWVKLWADRKVFEADGLVGPGKDGKPVRYIVSMFPYPSGDLHMGHAEVYAIGDAIARYARLNGGNVLHPIGWDSFGLPAENAALKRDLDPRDWTYANIAVQAEGFNKLGISFDWRTRLHTSDPEYYRWNQWLFNEMFRRGLAYRREAPVNWCPHDSTVLANEQVIQGRCERCGSIIERRKLAQWFLRITDYAQRLLDDMDQLGRWPEDVLRMQRNWIGRSTGATITFEVEGRSEPIQVFTTRPDTVFGATFFVVAVDAPLADELCAPAQRAEFESYRAHTMAATDIERLAADRPKTGVFLGRHVVNPVNGERLPLYASDYVLADYGSGAVMAVPAHDQRDLDFAVAMDLSVRTVVDSGEEEPATTRVATSGAGTLVRSGSYDGMPNDAGGAAIVADLAARGLGRPTVSYRLRDWLISRQRYWGTPIPIVHCPACGEVPVPDEQLPVRLPESGYPLRPDDRSPLARAEDWVRVACPSCGGDARRDTDTMDTFVDSSWYILRFPDPGFDEGPFNPAGIDRWLPADVYVGGKEHAILHLLYARFVTKFLFDTGRLGFTEPFTRLVNQGQVIMNGKSMSKSLGNLVNLQEQIAAVGPDAVRVTMLFAGPPEDDIDWADVSPAGSARWLTRVLKLAEDVTAAPDSPHTAEETDLRRAVHKLVAATTALMDDLRLNVAIARLMELTTVLRKAIDSGPGPGSAAVREGVEALARMLSCFAPFAAEEAWERLDRKASVAEHGWPQADPALLVEEKVTSIVQVDGKLRDRLEVPPDIDAAELERRARALPRIIGLVGNRDVRTVIVKAPRLVNIVLGR